MNRRMAGAAALLAVTVWAVLPVGRSAAFQSPTRSSASRIPARQPAANQPQRGPAASQPSQQPASGAAAASASSSSERTVPVARGRIHLINQVPLASDVPGIIDLVPFREGDAVESGEVVVKIRDDVPRAALATAQKLAESTVEREYASAAHDVAVATHQAATQANERVASAVPLIEVKKLELDAERARLQIEKANNDLEVAGLRADEAEAQLLAFTIKAPFAGIVTRVDKQVSEAVRQGDPILELVSTSRVRVEGFVAIRDFWSIKRGNLVHVQIDLSPERYEVEGRRAVTEAPRSPRPRHEIEERVFEGELVFVDRTVHPVTNMVRVWAEVDNPDDLLKGGLQARMTIYPDRMVDADPPETAAAGRGE